MYFWIYTYSVKEGPSRNIESQQTWRNEVHPSRLTDVAMDAEVEVRVHEDRTDRFASERFKGSGGHLMEREGGRGREEMEGGRREREERRRERGGVIMDDGRRGRRVDGERREGGDVERGRSVREGRRERGEVVRMRRHSEHVDRRGQVENEMEESHVRGGERGRGEGMEGRGRGRGRGRGGERGRGGWHEGGRRRVSEAEREREREEVERENRDFQEKRLLESLTDPRDVPKGTWYFEVSIH